MKIFENLLEFPLKCKLCKFTLTVYWRIVKERCPCGSPFFHLCAVFGKNYRMIGRRSPLELAPRMGIALFDSVPFSPLSVEDPVYPERDYANPVHLQKIKTGASVKMFFHTCYFSINFFLFYILSL